MATWKELGEVPDSDDESTWDSQELLPSLPAPAPAAKDAAKEAGSVGGTTGGEDNSIWDIPFSSQVSDGVQNVLPDPKPQDPDSSPSTPRSTLHDALPDSIPPLSAPLESGHRDESSALGSSPIRPRQAGNEESTPSSPVRVLEHATRTRLEVHIAPRPQESEQAMNEGGRPGRSLRPRKPIQEHPYLLENVQYNKTWKSHGLRPVRVLAEENKRRQEEDSQEQDFEDDSQLTGKNTAQEESDESQATYRFSPPPEIDDVALSDGGHPSSTPEPHSAMPRASFQNSQEDDDEFPDPNDVEKWKQNNSARRVHKRPPSPNVSSKRKRPRLSGSAQLTNDILVLPDTSDIFDIPASPPQTSPGVLAVTPTTVVNRLGDKHAVTLTPKPSSNMSSRLHSPVPAYQRGDLIDLTALENEGSENESDLPGSNSTSESEPDRVRLGARRIRGVLPASWLRLDQQASLQKTKPTIRRHSPDLSPQRSIKKGVAQRRLMLPQQGGGSSALFLSDDSDDSDSTVRPLGSDGYFRGIKSLTVEDDAGSVIEEDHIDHMFSRSKRTSKHSSEPRKKQKKSQQSIFNGQPSQRKHQQRIPSLLGHTRTLSGNEAKHLQAPKDSIGAEKSGRQRSSKRKQVISQPPRLSILDVVEPGAPSFIRIAARTVSKRRDRGRSSPSRKTIMLGTRRDTVDAIGTLKRWNEGRIQPRDIHYLPDRLQPREGEKAELTQTHVVSPPKLPKSRPIRTTISTRFSQPRRMVKQASMDDFVSVGTRTQPTRNVDADNFHIEKFRPRASSYRPAQLEMAGETANRHKFDAQKRALDALYRRSRKAIPNTQNLRLERSISGQVPVVNQQFAPETKDSPNEDAAPESFVTRRRVRPKKQIHPRSIDVSAPQYTHANDPLPRELSPPIVVLGPSKSEETGRLLGLAPYGTHYTQHFEVFPLDRGVFFHESTIIGSGRLKRALHSISLAQLNGNRGRCMFTLDERTLHWGQWDAQISSELGIVFDWVIERLDSPSTESELDTATPVRAVDFVLIYLQDNLSFGGPEGPIVFTSRLINVLQTFERRLNEILSNTRCTERSIIEVLTRILVITVRVLRLCQKLNPPSEAFHVEEILKRLATATAGILLRTDLKEVRDTYDRLQHMPFREKGIRQSEYYFICWVTLIRIFEEVRLPRAGFWEVIYPAVLIPGIDDTFDAVVLERAWRTLFTILPLGEFDTAGIATPGLRHTAPLEGWMIPQRLLRRVFQLYRSNGRQSPSFNDYLRAVISRCHYLVEQWGWYKGNAILGAIFDFFAAQDLHNLRNEEVYQSPLFLEELPGSPSLATTSEDRCFHIYLKLIAMSIQRLKKMGMMKEIKNLVTRLLPNHSRQYDKMMATHEAEIAALRNHHDLLCTLFWVAPPDLRPSIQSIEGLVVLGSSHKEACLINLRAWSRLSRFIVSSCEDISAYKPLADWQRNISHQVLEQFLSVETEVNQQLLGMSVEACKNITQQHKNAVISGNKKVAMDLLYFSMRAFLDVMRHTQTLGAASFTLNFFPLEQILTRLSFPSANSDWGILKVVLDILDYFLTRIDGFTTAEPLHTGQSWHEEDAIMLLERRFASPLISVVRGAVGIKDQHIGAGQPGGYGLCMEQAVVLAGRIGACLVHARLARFRQFFQVGKYNLFQDVTKPTTSPARKYVTLFVATMAERGVVDLKDFGVTPLSLALTEITKPLEYLAFENRLAISFKRLGEAYLEKAVIGVGTTPNYCSNRDLFNCIIVSMRRALHGIDTDQKSQLQSTFSKALRTTMDRMKADLRLMTLNSPEHLNYVEFVRLIISLIRSQDICPVDPFFYQISQEYSPSKQDPRLQTAAILSWGLKLEEGDTKALSGLFYLLFPSFKIALANGELENEAHILKESMKHVHVFNFMLSTMVPAIIRTAAQVSESWVLLDTYVEAIHGWLSSACIHRQIAGDVMMDILELHRIVLEATSSLQTRRTFEFRKEDVVSLTAMLKILNLLSPSVTAYLINEPRSPLASEYAEARDELTDFTRAADMYLSTLARNNDDQNMTALEPICLFKGLGILWSGGASPQRNEQIDRFSKHMIEDIRNNWVSNGTSITVKGPSRAQQRQRPSATQSGQGTRLPTWGGDRLLQGLREQIRAWNHVHDTTTRTRLHEAFLDEFLF